MNLARFDFDRFSLRSHKSRFRFAGSRIATTAPPKPSPQTHFVLEAMGEATARTEETLSAIRTSIEQVQSQIGSLDARMGLLDTSYAQVASQLDHNSRAVGDHTRIVDAIERRQEVMNQHMTALADAVAKPPHPNQL